MKKIFKLVVCLVLILSIATSSIISVSAYLYKPSDMESAEQLKHVEYWSQFDDPWSEDNISSYTGSTFHNAGCSTYAMAYALVKMGILNPKGGDTCKTLIDKARSAKIYDSSETYSWYFNYSRISELYPDVEYVGRGDGGDMSAEDFKVWAKAKINEGYYLIPCVYGGPTEGHMIFIDGFTSDGKMSTGDCGWGPGLTFEDSYNNFGSWKDMRIAYTEMLKYTKPCGSQPSIYDDTALRGTNDYSDADKAEYISLISEWQLEGMPAKSEIQSKADAHLQACKYNDTSNRLSVEEKTRIAEILDNKDADMPTLIQIVGTVLSIVGLALLVYALLLLLGFFLDKFNTVLDVSTVGILTLGHIKILTKSEKEQLDEKDIKQKGYTTGVKLFVIIGLLCIIGGLLVSGVLIQLIYKVTYGIVY